MNGIWSVKGEWPTLSGRSYEVWWPWAGMTSCDVLWYILVEWEHSEIHHLQPVEKQLTVISITYYTPCVYIATHSSRLMRHYLNVQLSVKISSNIRTSLLYCHCTVRLWVLLVPNISVNNDRPYTIIYGRVSLSSVHQMSCHCHWSVAVQTFGVWDLKHRYHT